MLAKLYIELKRGKNLHHYFITTDFHLLKQMRRKKWGINHGTEIFYTDDGSAMVQRRQGDERRKVVGMYPPLPSQLDTPPSSSTSSQLTQTIQLHPIYTINASAAISTMFYLSPGYRKWLVQQWLVVGGVNGSS